MSDANNTVYLTRKISFCAGHRLNASALSAEENRRMFDKCNHVHGHGHNYVVEVTVCGKMDPITKMVMNATTLKSYMTKGIMNVMDHKFLDKDINYFFNSPSTVENIAVFIWNQLLPYMKHESAALYEVKVHETENISAIYRG